MRGAIILSGAKCEARKASNWTKQMAEAAGAPACAAKAFSGRVGGSVKAATQAFYANGTSDQMMMLAFAADAGALTVEIAADGRVCDRMLADKAASIGADWDGYERATGPDGATCLRLKHLI